jgi:hypothetical protein
MRFRDHDAHDAFFVFRGVHEPHRDQIEVVLQRQGLAVVAETDPGTFRLLGVHTPQEERVWGVLEEHGLLSAEDADAVLSDGGDRAALDALADRGLAFRSPVSGRVHALSRLVEHLM